LSKAQPTARRAEVAKALETILADTDHWSRKNCLAALAVWGTKDNVPALIKLVSDSDHFVRNGAITALGKLKDERAAEALASRLPQLGDRHNAAQALRAIGSKAEMAVIPFLEHADGFTRREACSILKDIGTKESKAALEKLALNGDVVDTPSAKEALKAIAARK
jgi:HEAT repeat protein